MVCDLSSGFYNMASSPEILCSVSKAPILSALCIERSFSRFSKYPNVSHKEYITYDSIPLSPMPGLHGTPGYYVSNVSSPQLKIILRNNPSNIARPRLISASKDLHQQSSKVLSRRDHGISRYRTQTQESTPITATSMTTGKYLKIRRTLPSTPSTPPPSSRNSLTTAFSTSIFWISWSLKLPASRKTRTTHTTGACYTTGKCLKWVIECTLVGARRMYIRVTRYSTCTMGRSTMFTWKPPHIQRQWEKEARLHSRSQMDWEDRCSPVRKFMTCRPIKMERSQSNFRPRGLILLRRRRQVHSDLIVLRWRCIIEWKHVWV